MSENRDETFDGCSSQSAGHKLSKVQLYVIPGVKFFGTSLMSSSGVHLLISFPFSAAISTMLVEKTDHASSPTSDLARPLKAIRFGIFDASFAL
jgi:hypothetical protein